jgi:L-2-hydroxyglutarate oxidase LhgO
VRIVPFRGEYYDLVPQKHGPVRNLVYPVPDPASPFLRVHFTRMVRGGVEAGRMVHVLNAPSPAAIASIPIGRAIAERAQKRFGLASR